MFLICSHVMNRAVTAETTVMHLISMYVNGLVFFHIHFKFYRAADIFFFFFLFIEHIPGSFQNLYDGYL